jgi:PEP-CTERM motif
MQIKPLAALSAVVSLMALAVPAQAEIVASGPVNIAIPDDFDGVYVNLVTGANGSAAPAGWDINPYSALPGGFNLWGATTTTWLSLVDVSGGYVLAPNTPISAAGSFFRPGGDIDVGNEISLNATHLFGVQFTNEALGDATNYGWVAITFGADVGTRAITGWAYETSGDAILAGVVPEPSTYAMLLAGLAAVGGMAARRRKASAAA